MPPHPRYLTPYEPEKDTYGSATPARLRAVTPEELTVRLAAFPLFAGIAPAEVEEICRQARPMHLAKGSVLFGQEDPAHSFFLLLDGRLRVTRVTPAGQQVLVRFINPGEICGVAMAMARTTYPATAEIVVDGTALAWPIAIWPRLVERFPTLSSNMLRTVGSRLQEAQARVVEMSTSQVEQRVAHALLRLARQSGRKVATGIEIDFPISRQDVAEMTGTTLHTVSRILSAWEERRLVEGGRMRIVIRDIEGLRRMAERVPD